MIFGYICPGFSFILQIIKASQSIKIIRTRNFTVFTMCLQFGGNLWQILTFPNHIGETADFKLDHLKTFDYSQNPGKSPLKQEKHPL